MSEDIGRIVLAVLSEYDYRLVTRHEMHKLAGYGGVMGLTVFDKKKIYVCKDLPRSDKDVTMLHEFGHVYLESIGEGDTSEKKVDKLAYEWLKKLYVG